MNVVGVDGLWWSECVRLNVGDITGSVGNIVRHIEGKC